MALHLLIRFMDFLSDINIIKRIFVQRFHNSHLPFPLHLLFLFSRRLLPLQSVQLIHNDLVISFILLIFLFHLQILSFILRQLLVLWFYLLLFLFYLRMMLSFLIINSFSTFLILQFKNTNFVLQNVLQLLHTFDILCQLLILFINFTSRTI